MTGPSTMLIELEASDWQGCILLVTLPKLKMKKELRKGTKDASANHYLQFHTSAPFSFLCPSE